MGKRLHLIYKEYFVGGFLILATLALLLLIIATLSKNEMFTETYHLRAVFTNKSDLRIGANVKIRGIKIGQVINIYFNDENKVEIQLAINSKYQKLIRNNSKASIIQERFPISDRIISITTGTPDYKILEENMFIKTKESIDLDIIINQSLVALDKLNMIVNKLEKGEGTAGALLNDDKLYNDLQIVMNKTSNAASKGIELLKKANSLSYKIEKNTIDSLPKTIQLANTSLSNINDLVLQTKTVLDSVNNILSTVNNISLLLPYILKDGHGLLENADHTINAVKNTWPISRNIEEDIEDPPLFIIGN